MRTPLAVTLLALAATCQAQQPAQPAGGRALRIAVRLDSKVDGKPEDVNRLQYNVWAHLQNYGLRVDSPMQIRYAAWDKYILERATDWNTREPNAPPASITIDGNASCEYGSGEVEGVGLAHAFKGKLKATVKAGNETLGTFEWELTWPRSQEHYKRGQVQVEFGDLIANTLVLAVLKLERVRAGIPEARKADLAKWENATRQRLLNLLKERHAEIEMAKFLRTLEPKPSDGK